MRDKRHEFIRTGIALAAALALTASSCSRKPPPAALKSSPGTEKKEPAASATEQAELEALRIKAAALEAQFAGLETKEPAPPGTVPQKLMGHLDKLDGQGLYRTMEERLLGGEDGHRDLLEFLLACDQDRDKLLTLVHDSRLVFALLRLVARYPGETADFSGYLIRNTRAVPDSFIRREIYNFLPVFLNYHRGKYPELRQLLKEDIVFQLKAGGEYLYKLTLAMRDLQFKPPIEAMEPILHNLKSQTSHGVVIAHLAGRGDEGLQALVRFVEKSGDSSHQSVSQALIRIIDVDALGRKGLARRFIEHKDPVLRKTATFHYFRHPRELVDYERALGYLNSEVTVAQQTLIIGQLKRKSPLIYQELLKEVGKVKAEKARAILEKAASRARKEAGDEG